MRRFPPLKILVAMDRSRSAIEAWREAQAWSMKLGAQVEAVHVEPVLPGGIERESFEAWFRKEVTVSGYLNIVDGEPGRTVADYARAHGFDLIAIGTHGRTGLARLVEGSVAEAVVGHSRVPVLAVKNRREPVRSILVPLVFRGYALPALDQAARFASALGARLHLLHVVPWPGDIAAARAALKRTLRRLTAFSSEDLRPTFELAAGAPVREIAKAADRHDLVVLVEHPRSIWSEIFLGTTAEQVVRSSLSPVLAVPAGRKD